MEEESVGTVVSTLVLCTVDFPDVALAEVSRVLRPGGQLLFIEHVRSHSPRVAHWQASLVIGHALKSAGVAGATL